jgi:RHS repeat-associated protein
MAAKPQSGISGATSSAWYNVTAAVTANAAATQTVRQRFRAYGQIAYVATGPYSGIPFNYVGSAGYRRTGRAHSSHYVRARHLSSQDARWTTVDLLWPRQNVYSYVLGNPSSNFDSSGLSTCFCTPGHPCNVKFSVQKAASVCAATTQGSLLTVLAYSFRKMELDVSCAPGQCSSGCDIVQIKKAYMQDSPNGPHLEVWPGSLGFTEDTSPVCYHDQGAGALVLLDNIWPGRSRSTCGQDDKKGNRSLRQLAIGKQPDWLYPQPTEST